LLLLTFTRKLELVHAPWTEVDLDRAEWVIAAERMKMGKPHVVPLSQQALQCFKELKSLAGSSPFVFPNLGNPRRPMSGTTLNKVFHEIGWDHFTPHSARSTASTELNKQGWSADAIELQLAHTERNRVRAAYNHADRMEERRRMMQAWADYHRRHRERQGCIG
jgi:integrase